jgi:hypothetical protein
MNWGSEYKETEVYLNRFNILLNLMLERERNAPIALDGSDTSASKLARQLSKLPSKPLEMIADKLLGGSGNLRVGEYRERMARNKIDGLITKSNALDRKIVDLERLQPNGWQEELEIKKRQNENLLDQIKLSEDVHRVLRMRDMIRSQQSRLTSWPYPDENKTNEINRDIAWNKEQLKKDPNKKINEDFFNIRDGFSPKKCQSKNRNRSTGRCRKTPCRLEKTRDVTTGQCRSKKSPGRKRKSHKRKSIKRKSPSKKSRR